MAQKGKTTFICSSLKTTQNKLTTSKGVENHTKIINNEAYIKFIATTLGTIPAHCERDMIELKKKTARGNDAIRISDIDISNPLYHRQCFSLKYALKKIKALGCNPIFYDIKNWNREVTETNEGFGGRIFHTFPISGKTSSLINLSNFNAHSLAENCLPHCQITDKKLLQPNTTLNTRTIVGGNTLGFCIEDEMTAFGMFTEVQKRQ